MRRELRSYATSESSPPKDDGPEEQQPVNEGTSEYPTPTPEMYLKVLENTASAPWLALEHTANDKSTPKEKMARAYSRAFQIFMYLGRPQEEEAAMEFLNVSPALSHQTHCFTRTYIGLRKGVG